MGIIYAVRAMEPSQEFRYEWQWSSVDAGRWLVFGSAVITGASAWEAWLMRRRLRDFEAGLPNPGATRWRVWVGVATWWLALQGLVLTGHLIAAGAADAVGSVSLVAVATQFAGVAGWCGLGVAIGWWVRSPLAPPVLAALVVMVTVLNPEVSGHTLRSLTWFGSVRSLVGLEFGMSHAVLRLLFFGALTALVVTAVRRRWLGPAVTALATVTALTTAVLVTSPVRPELVLAAPDRHVCVRGDGVTVCGVPELRGWLGAVGRELGPVRGRLRGLGVEPPTAFRLYGGEQPAEPEPGVGVIRVLLTDLREGRSLTPALVAAATVPSGCAAANPSEEFLLTGAAMFGWVLREVGVDAPTAYPAGLVDEIRRLPVEVQRAWVVATYPRLWRCESVSLPPQLSGSGPDAGG
jgi:hypothetical protein